jgi:hypothetical protein
MATFSLTLAEIQNRIENLLRRLTGSEKISYQDKKTINDAINAAMIDICLDVGIAQWRFIQANDTEDTTSGTAYVDLDENIFNVVSGTVRIASEDVTLNPASLEYIRSIDPDADETGVPEVYALVQSADAETLRMEFYPIPNGTYTVAFTAEVIPDEDSISTFPAWMHACLKDKATANALRDLGLPYIDFERSYKDRKQQNKAHQGHDVPMHINRRRPMARYRPLESRIP